MFLGRGEILKAFVGNSSPHSTMTLSLEDIALRPYTKNDLSTLIERHQVLCWEEFSYPPDTFGKHVSDGLDQLIQIEDAQLWIAEYQPPTTCGSEIPEKIWAGSIAIVPIGELTGRIRLLLVGSQFRACGLGNRLIVTALEYCRTRGYKRAALSTTGACVAAHKLYAKHEFERIQATPGTPWGMDSTDEWWEKTL
jgi:GNAT superfamily N-acetyltransferase